MNKKLKLFAVAIFSFGSILEIHSQGYLVPNGVTYGGYIPSIGSTIHVLQNPTNGDYTGFNLPPQGANTFSFLPFADEGVRVFLVSSNDPVSLQPILSQNYTELGYPPVNYFFDEGSPFYLGLYTGYTPVNGIYSDPLFGWAHLVNNAGVIELLDGALEYGGAGIYASTANYNSRTKSACFGLIGDTAAWLSPLEKVKTKLKCLAIVGFTFGAALQLHSQGYLVPNGVTYGGYIPSAGSIIHVLQNSTNGDYTGFTLPPQGSDIFSFSVFLDDGVRVFLVSSGDPISLQPILSQSYTELGYPPVNYLFAEGDPFYVGLYTGYTPVNGIYSDPLFGWAHLVNNAGVIELLDGALVYKAVGIYAGTQTIIPEPSTIGLFALGGLLLGRRWRKSFER